MKVDEKKIIHRDSSQVRTKLAFDSNAKESSQRDAYASEIVSMADEHPNLVLIDADLMTVGKTHVFREKYPNRHIQIGIAEQNMMGIAAGLAQMGKLPIAHSLAVFGIGRTFDQIRESICYSELNVKIVGYHAGLTLAPDGATHQTMEDIALMTSLPNMSVVAPADAQQTIDLLPQILKNDTPTYLRLLFPNIPKTIKPGTSVYGKSQILNEGSDITIIANGQLVAKCVQAAKHLKKEQNISVELINIHTIKPYDFETVNKSLQKTGIGLVVEEHNSYGGIGSIVSYHSALECPTKIEYLNTNDKFGTTGLPEELLEAYGLSESSIIKKVEDLIK
ncbi:MAG: transketolase [Dehalococcoidia bacterium]|nr:transketolase [Dehalococcoidia bacterium]